jgi:hypothetical protein
MNEDQLKTKLAGVLPPRVVDLLLPILLDAITGLLSRCGSQSNALRGMKQPGRVESLMVERAIRARLAETGTKATPQQIAAAVKATLAHSQSATESEHAALLAECQKYEMV